MPLAPLRLHEAALKGHVRMVERLIAASANIDELDEVRAETQMPQRVFRRGVETLHVPVCQCLSNAGRDVGFTTVLAKVWPLMEVGARGWP